jgi:hypothetical protein
MVKRVSLLVFHWAYPKAERVVGTTDAKPKLVRQYGQARVRFTTLERLVSGWQEPHRWRAAETRPIWGAIPPQRIP